MPSGSSDAPYENPLSPGKHQRQRPVTAPAPRHAAGTRSSSRSRAAAPQHVPLQQHHSTHGMQHQHQSYASPSNPPHAAHLAMKGVAGSGSHASGRSASARHYRPAHSRQHEQQPRHNATDLTDSLRFKPRGFNPDYTPGHTLHSGLPVTHSPAAKAAQKQQGAKGPMEGYRAAPVYGVGNKYGGAATWTFKPADFTWRNMTQLEKERAVEEAYRNGTAGHGGLYSSGTAGSKGLYDSASSDYDPQDPLLRYVTATRGTISKDDLGRHREPMVGFKTVPGAPDARLVGGEWRWMPKVSAKAPQGRAWTECFGPVGGGSLLSTYYGKHYDPDGRAAYTVY